MLKHLLLAQVRGNTERLRASLRNVGDIINRAFSHDVTAAILLFQNNEMGAMLVSQTSPVGVELFSYLKNFLCSNKFAEVLDTCVKTLYSCFYLRVI